MNTDRDPPSADSPAPTDPASPSPRAFAQGVGVVFQTAGVIMALSSCVICALSGKWDPVSDRAQVLRQMQQGDMLGVPAERLWHEPARAGLMLTVVFTTVGGLALAGFGLGLQSETPRAAWGALISVTLLAAVLIAAGVGLWIGQAPWLARCWHALLTGLVLVLLGFALVAWRQVMAHPPPPGLHAVPPGFDVRDVMAGEKPSRMLIEQMRARIQAEQRELERLERELENRPDKN